MNLTTLLSRPYSLLFGYDIFISYAHRGSQVYAGKLDEQLTSLDYSCFIDKKEVPSGRPLNKSLAFALRASKTLILIGTEGALNRDYVQLEFQEFAKTGRPIIPVNVGEALARQLESQPWKVIKERDLVWIDETAEALEHGLPSPEVYEGVQNLFQFTRRNVVRRRWVSGAVVFILGTAIMALWQAQKARAQTKFAKTQMEIAERQTIALREERQNLAAANDKLRNKNIELNEERKTALSNAEKARTQEALALANAEKATRRQKSAESLYLADQGQRVYETNPLLGLAFSLEALDHVPSDDSSTRIAIERSVKDRIQSGRIGRLDKSGNDFGQPYFLNSPFFVLSRPGLKGEIRSVESGLAVEMLAAEVERVSGAVEEDYILPPPLQTNLPITPPASIPYFVIHYKDGPGELRRRADASLVSRGVASIAYRPDLPFFLVKYDHSRSELRRVDNDQVSVPLSNKDEKSDVIALAFVSGSPYFLVGYENSPAEIRSVKTGEFLDKVDLDSNTKFSITDLAVSDDLLCYSVSDAPYDLTRHSKLRCLNGDQPSGLKTVISRVFFSPFNHQYIVAYPDSPGELRSTNSKEVTALKGTVRDVAFNTNDKQCAILYIDAPGEMRPLNNKPIELSSKFTAIENNQNSSGFHASDVDGKVVLLTVETGTLKETPLTDLEFFRTGPPTYIIAKNALSGAQEIHHRDTGTVLQLTGRYAAANRFRYLGGEDFPYIEVGRETGFDYQTLGLLHSGTGNLIALDVNPTSGSPVTLSPGRSLFFTAPGLASSPKVYRVDTGQAIASYDSKIYFSPDEAYLVATNSPNGGVDKFIWTKTGEAVDLTDKVAGVLFTGNASVVEIKYEKQYEELRRTSDGKFIARGRQLRLIYDDGKYFIVTDDNNRSELWATQDASHNLTDLGTNLAGASIQSVLATAIVWYGDKRAYILDLNWLSDIRKHQENPADKLISLSCEPFTAHVLATLDLKPLVQTTPLKVCHLRSDQH